MTARLIRLLGEARRPDFIEGLPNLSAFGVAWLDGITKFNGRLMAYKLIEFSGSQKCCYSRWIMIRRGMYPHWREGAVFDLSRRVSELKRSGIGTLDSKLQAHV